MGWDESGICEFNLDWFWFEILRGCRYLYILISWLFISMYTMHISFVIHGSSWM